MRRIITSFWGLTLVVLGGCPGNIDNPEAFLSANPNMPISDCDKDVVQDILSNPATCASVGCHGASLPAAGLDLASPNLADRLIGAPGSVVCDGEVQIDVEEPERSLIYTKLFSPTPCGAIMPLSGARLSTEDQNCVLGWIQGLAVGSIPTSSIALEYTEP